MTSWIFLLLISPTIRAQNAIKATNVVRKFYENYDADDLTYGRVEFEKRKEDWYIAKITDYKDGVIVRGLPQLFYNGKAKQFLSLDMVKRESADTIDYRVYMDSLLAFDFDLQPFYGYAGWYNDVIREYESKTRLTDDELYALGRAYSAKALAPTDNSDDVAPGERYRLSFDVNAYSDRQLKTFITNDDKAIARFRQLARRTPGYPTSVGDIRDKYAHELMSKFHMLLTFSLKNLAKITLPKNLYKDSLLNINRRRLTACPPGSILMSFDDNDFYPVLYLQYYEGLRKDVYLMNYSLIGLDKFIYRITQPQFNAEGIKLSVDTSVYKGTSNDYVMVMDSAYSMPFEQVITVFRSPVKPGMLAKVISANGIDILQRREGADSIMAHIALNKARYLLKNQWILLDIINNLNGRKICLPKKFEDDQLPGLNSYLELSNGLYIFNN